MMSICSNSKSILLSPSDRACGHRIDWLPKGFKKKLALWAMIYLGDNGPESLHESPLFTKNPFDREQCDEQTEIQPCTQSRVAELPFRLGFDFALWR